MVRAKCLAVMVLLLLLLLLLKLLPFPLSALTDERGGDGVWLGDWL